MYKIMPGYVIHLAVAKVFEQNNKIENTNDFEKGVIIPDITLDKQKSHYMKKDCSWPELNKYIAENGKNLSDYQTGYFLHLVTDYLFYNKFLKKCNSDIYEDYDISNARIMKKYGIVSIPSEIEDTVKFKNGKLKLLNEADLYNFINAVGRIDVREIIEQTNIEDNLNIEIETNYWRKLNESKGKSNNI